MTSVIFAPIDAGRLDYAQFLLLGAIAGFTIILGLPDLVWALVAVWWFILTAVVILSLKARYSTNKLLIQEGIALLLIMSTTFLFNYPYYLMLGVVGVLFLCHPLAKANLVRNVA